MKRILLLLTATAFFTACNDTKKTDAPAATVALPDAGVTVNMPYTASYSASFKLGNPDYATKVAQGSWKDWETNNMDNLKNWVADTIMVFQSDNKFIKGVDSLIANWKRGRVLYKTVIDTINAIVPLYSTDKKQDWVLVAATEINENNKGVRDTVSILENWRFNKDGKADMLLQYERRTKKN
jgi:hypothetical protein